MGTRHLYWILTGPSFAVCLPLLGSNIPHVLPMGGHRHLRSGRINIPHVLLYQWVGIVIFAQVRFVND
jgi:hypothetical protein